MAQGMIHQHQRQHRFGNRRGTDRHARIMAAGGRHQLRLTVLVDGMALLGDARRGLDRQVDDNILPGGNTTEDAAGMVAGKAGGREFIAMQRTRWATLAKPSPISTPLTAFMPIMA